MCKKQLNKSIRQKLKFMNLLNMKLKNLRLLELFFLVNRPTKYKIKRVRTFQILF